MRKVLDKIFGGLKMNWPVVASLAAILGIYTALVAMLVPDGNSFHDIAVTPEWWVLPAIIIIVNCKKPLEAAIKTFVFFLISQPLVYLIQVPFNTMGWELFGYYKYWFVITLLTFPGAFVGWYIKKDKWYSGVILSAMTVFLVWTGFNYVLGFSESFPNHLLSAIYCFGIIPVFIFGIFKKWQPRVVTLVISVLAIIVLFFMGAMNKPFETYNNTFLSEHGIVLEGEPWVTFYAGEKVGGVEVINAGDLGYTFKLSGEQGARYEFTLTDDSENEYCFEYYFDADQNVVVINRIEN